MSEICLFVSGKGGVGKSALSANLAVLLARKGRSVALIDADIGLRSQDLLLGMENSVVFDLVDVARGNCLLSQSLLPHPDLPGLCLLPASQFARCRDLDPRKLKKILSLLGKEKDFILIDCPAGMERGLRNVLNAGAGEPVLVTTPDDLCLRGAERIVSLVEEKKLSRPRLIVNRLDSEMVYAGEMYSARTVSLQLDLPLFGEIPEDRAFCAAQLRHGLVVDYDCEARRALRRIAGRLLGETHPFPDYGSRRPSFFRKHFPRRLKEVKSDREQRK